MADQLATASKQPLTTKASDRSAGEMDRNERTTGIQPGLIGPAR